MKETLKLVSILTFICLTAGSLLAWVNNVTKDRIQEAMKAEKIEAIKKVLPPCDNQPDSDTVTVTNAGVEWTFYVARMNNGFAGAAFETSSSGGYGGDIRLTVGVRADGRVQGITIIEHKETPGLGAKIEGEDFRNGFVDRSVRNTDWRVSKDGGDIDGITAATISSRAVVDAVKAGLDVFLEHEDKIEAKL